jgi:hypothetical protein
MTLLPSAFCYSRILSRPTIAVKRSAVRDLYSRSRQNFDACARRDAGAKFDLLKRATNSTSHGLRPSSCWSLEPKMSVSASLPQGHLPQESRD